MAKFEINKDECIGCGACSGECPTNAIIDKGGVYEITDKCIGCGACSVVCPVSAISEKIEKK